jgi:hypothetical protein
MESCQQMVEELQATLDMGKPHLFVSWNIRNAAGGRVTYLLELVETRYANGQIGWELEREVDLWADGRIRSKSPTKEDPYPSAERRPDPIEAIERGDMTEIPQAEFERYWLMPVYHPPGLLRRLLNRAGR